MPNDLAATEKQRAARPIRILKPCDRCRNWADCQGHIYHEHGEYYYLDEIRYCRYQVRWLIAEFLMCKGDQIVSERETWPSDIYASGYTDAERTSHQVRANPPGQAVQLVVAELAARLEACGKDGLLLVHSVCNGTELSQGAKDALSYSLGGKRKRQGFVQWLAGRNRDRRKPVIIT